MPAKDIKIDEAGNNLIVNRGAEPKSLIASAAKLCLRSGVYHRRFRIFGQACRSRVRLTNAQIAVAGAIASRNCAAEHHIGGMQNFDFNAPAELFTYSTGRRWGSSLQYLRFETASEAIRHVMESLGENARAGAFIETDAVSLGAGEIKSMYERIDFPLLRNSRAEPQS